MLDSKKHLVLFSCMICTQVDYFGLYEYVNTWFTEKISDFDGECAVFI